MDGRAPAGRRVFPYPLVEGPCCRTDVSAAAGGTRYLVDAIGHETLSFGRASRPFAAPDLPLPRSHYVEDGGGSPADSQADTLPREGSADLALRVLPKEGQVEVVYSSFQVRPVGSPSVRGVESSVHSHLLDCGEGEARVLVRILAKEKDAINARLREAIAIKKRSPELNVRRDSDLADLIF